MLTNTNEFSNQLGSLGESIDHNNKEMMMMTEGIIRQHQNASITYSSIGDSV